MVSRSCILSRIYLASGGALLVLWHFFPFKLAGLYDQSNQTHGHCLSDFAVSSYTPTVSALIERVSHPRKMDIASRKLLLISQPNTLHSRYDRRDTGCDDDNTNRRGLGEDAVIRVVY